EVANCVVCSRPQICPGVQRRIACPRDRHERSRKPRARFSTLLQHSSRDRFASVGAALGRAIPRTRMSLDLNLTVPAEAAYYKDELAFPVSEYQRRLDALHKNMD